MWNLLFSRVDSHLTIGARAIGLIYDNIALA